MSLENFEFIPFKEIRSRLTISDNLGTSLRSEALHSFNTVVNKNNAT